MSRRTGKQLLPGVPRGRVHQAARVVALVAALLTYCLIPLTGRTDIGVATVAAAALAYGLVLLAAFRTAGALKKGGRR